MNFEEVDSNSLELLIASMREDPSSYRSDELLHLAKILTKLRRFKDAYDCLKCILDNADCSPDDVFILAELLREIGQYGCLVSLLRCMITTSRPHFDLLFGGVQSAGLSSLQVIRELIRPDKAGLDSDAAFQAAMVGDFEGAHSAFLKYCQANSSPELYFNLGLVAYALAPIVRRSELFSNAILSFQYYAINRPDDPRGLIWLNRAIEHAPVQLRPKEIDLARLSAEASRLESMRDLDCSSVRYIAPTNWSLSDFYGLPSALSKLQRLEKQPFERVVCYVVGLDPQFLQLQSVWSEYLEFRTFSFEANQPISPYSISTDLIVSFAGSEGPLSQFVDSIEKNWFAKFVLPSFRDVPGEKLALLHYLENQDRELYPNWKLRLATSNSTTYKAVIDKVTEKGFRVMRLPDNDLLACLQKCSLVISADSFLVGLARLFDKPTLCINASIPMGYCSPGQLILPKLIWSSRTQANIPFKEYGEVAAKLFDNSLTPSQIANKEYQVRDNSPQEMLQGLEQILSPDFRRTATSNQIGSDFLHRHARVF